MIIIALSPIAELRGSIPYGIVVLGLPPVEVFIVSVVANSFVSPLLIPLLRWAESYFSKFPRIRRIMDAVFHRTRRRAAKSVERWEEFALFLFVAVPLPGTGAWTGSLVAHLFGLDYKKSVVTINAGVLTAGVVIYMLTTGAYTLL